MSPRKLLEAAIIAYGSEAKLGAVIGYTQNAVHQAKRRGTVSWEMATMLHHVSDGLYDRAKLCPERQVVLKRRIAALPTVRKRTPIKRSHPKAKHRSRAR
jgi:hypothetical protein